MTSSWSLFNYQDGAQSNKHTSQLFVEKPQISDATLCGYETSFIGVTEKCKLTVYEIIGVRACSDVIGYVKY